MDFSIITPSYNMLNFLKVCVASVNDQEKVSVEHIIVDGNSKDGTAQWLTNMRDLKSIIEKDSGMYDAINKGLLVSCGEILGYLNCDEQYLPETLEFVKEYFNKNPEIDVIFGDTLLINPSGELISFRKGYHPRYNYILLSHLYVLSCTMFFRRKIIDEGNLFDLNYKTVGDADFVLRLLKNKYKIRHIKKYFSVFTITNSNLSNSDAARIERVELIKRSSKFTLKLKYLINIIRLIEKFISGAYFQGGSINYKIYTKDCIENRQNFEVKKATFHWPSEKIKMNKN